MSKFNARARPSAFNPPSPGKRREAELKEIRQRHAIANDDAYDRRGRCLLRTISAFDVLELATERSRHLAENTLPLTGGGRGFMPRDRLANPPKRVVEILRQLEEKKTPDVAFKLAFLLENLVDAAESRDVARFVKQMMETKILQGLHALLRFGEPIIAKGALPPLIRAAAQAGIDGK